jgi:hypothetical protein
MALEGKKLKGAASGRSANPVAIRQGLSKGAKPRNRCAQFVASSDLELGADGTWVRLKGNAQPPLARRRLRRVNPKSAAGVKQNRRGLEGRKPSRG